MTRIADRQPVNLSQNSALAGLNGVFSDRAEAGQAVAELLMREALPQPLLLALPAGGVPVAAAAAELLHWPLAAAVVSKILLPWNTEAGYGAVAWDGTLQLNLEMVERLGLSDADIAAGIAATRKKVAARVQSLMGPDGLPDLTGRSAILVDDGLASGFTMLTAVAALKKAAPDRIIAAVPTGHLAAVRQLAAEVHLVVCANLRSAYPFSVAAAYRQWRDVTESEALELLRQSGAEPPEPG